MKPTIKQLNDIQPMSFRISEWPFYKSMAYFHGMNGIHMPLIITHNKRQYEKDKNEFFRSTTNNRKD